MTEQNQELPASRLNWGAFVVVAAIVIILWGATGYFLYNNPERGTFGDMFGSINALFSGLAFAGVIFAILLQRQELQLQRKELELTRGELEGQKQQLAAQNESFKRQNFEHTFFKLLGLQEDILSEIETKYATTVLKGEEAIHIIYQKDLLPSIKGMLENYVENEEKIRKRYVIFYRANSVLLGRYHTSIYTILKYINEESIGDKFFYASIFTTKFTPRELEFLSYHYRLGDISEGFKRLLKNYLFLK